MKNITKLTFTLLFVSFMLPNLAFASWWNPTSWNIYKWLFIRPVKIETIATTTIKASSYNDKISPDTYTETFCNGTNYTSCSSDEKFICPSDGVSPATCDCKNGYTLGSDNTCQLTKTQQQNQSANQNYSQSEIQQNGVGGANTSGQNLTEGQMKQQNKIGTLCNGIYWSACPSGQDFVCPSNGGSASCQQSPQQATQNQAAEIAQQQAAQAQITLLLQQIASIKQKALREAIGNITGGGTSVVGNGNATIILNKANQQIKQLNSEIYNIESGSGLSVSTPTPLFDSLPYPPYTGTTCSVINNTVICI